MPKGEGRMKVPFLRDLAAVGIRSYHRLGKTSRFHNIKARVFLFWGQNRAIHGQGRSGLTAEYTVGQGTIPGRAEKKKKISTR